MVRRAGLEGVGPAGGAGVAAVLPVMAGRMLDIDDV